MSLLLSFSRVASWFRQWKSSMGIILLFLREVLFQSKCTTEFLLKSAFTGHHYHHHNHTLTTHKKPHTHTRWLREWINFESNFSLKTIWWNLQEDGLTILKTQQTALNVEDRDEKIHGGQRERERSKTSETKNIPEATWEIIPMTSVDFPSEEQTTKIAREMRTSGGERDYKGMMVAPPTPTTAFKIVTSILRRMGCFQSHHMKSAIKCEEETPWK